jgi:hypothetical protein
MKDLAAALADKPEQYVIDFQGIGRPLVLQRNDVEAARERIIKRYRVDEEQFLGTDETK